MLADNIRREVRAEVDKRHAEGYVRQAVIEHLVQSELDEYKSIILKALDRRKVLVKRRDSIKPNHVLYDNDSKKIDNSEGYTKEKAEERRWLAEEITRGDIAIAKAMDNGEYELVKNFIKD